MILWYFSVLVADVEVREDGVFFRLRKETVVCEDKDSDKEIPSSVPVPVVEEVPEIGSEVAVSLEGVYNIPMEELFGGQCDGSVTSSSVAS